MDGTVEVKTPVVQTEVTIAKAPTRTPVEMTGFLVVPKNLDELYRLCSALVKSRMVPERFKTAEEVMGAVIYAGEHFPKNPITAIRQIAVIEGTPTLFGDLPMSKVRSSGLLEYAKEFYFDKENNKLEESDLSFVTKLFGATCVVKRKGEPEEVKRSFTLAMKERAGLGKSRSGNLTVWDKYPHLMLKYRARGSALKDVFADVLVGVAQGGYDVEAVDVTDSFAGSTNGVDKAAQLNEKLKIPHHPVQDDTVARMEG